MKKASFLKRKKFIKRISFLTILVLVISLISTSSISLTLKNISKYKENCFLDNKQEISDGLAPNCREIPISSNEKSIDVGKLQIGDDCEIMYGYCAYDPSEQLEEGPVYFDTCFPGTIEQIAPTESYNFISGGTGTMGYYRWLGCEYDSGALWDIDLDSGKMDYIGGGGANLNTLAWDPVSNRLYGVCSNDYLWEIDPDTGEQELIGSLDYSGELMIGMAFDAEGNLYGWDLGSDKLWIIDPEKPEAEEVGPLGIDLNYAQDGDFYRETDTLYLTAYTTTGQLYVCDKCTGQCELIDNFQGGAQITGSIFEAGWCTEHDIALKSIDFPETGPVTPDMDMKITVKNVGNNTETFDAQMEIIRNVSGKILIDENFSGTFPPEGWNTDSWKKCDSYGYPDPPCACLYKYDQGQNSSAYIISNAVDASEYKTCKLRFYFAGDMNYPQYCSFYVRYRRNDTSPWIDITPWDNPFGEDIQGWFETQITNSLENCGEALQIKWEYIGYYSYYNYFYLDSVKLIEGNDGVEYAEIVEDITIHKGEIKQIEFPGWTPSYWQNESYENIWVEYPVHAFIICESDHNPRNDDKNKFVNLYFGFFHDVGCKEVNGPESGPAQTFPVTGIIRNFGQYDECCFKTYAEIAELDMTSKEQILTEDFTDSTFPPSGWTKTHDNWIYSFSSYSEGDPGEASFYYEPKLKDTSRLYTPLIDTSGFDGIQIEFKHYVIHNNSSYKLKLETSIDGINWDTCWQIIPNENVGPEKIKIFTGKNIGANIYISWTFEGKSYDINNWYIDDILINGYTALEPEYEDDVCISTIDPGEELELVFDDWTPEYLIEEITDKKNYVVKAWTNMEDPEDKNSANDLFKDVITLDFFHDVKIKNITSPSNSKYRYLKYKDNIPMPEIYIQPGTEDIDVIVENNGTFQELDLTCHALIWDYFTNGNGSLVYEDEITDIDLGEPNGGTKLLNFDDFTFVEESVYRLFIDLPHEIDDYPENNQKNLIIGVDDSDPNSWIEEIDPPEPNGNNGWYVSEVEVTICAEDPEIQEGIPGSGICAIIVDFNGYKQTFYDDCITIILDEERSSFGFYAVDCAGNVETRKYFEIDIDKTKPDVNLDYEVTGGNPFSGWELTFTATATDDTSGIDYVEYYFNEELQEVINSPGPYEWTYTYYGGIKVIVKVVAYDKAGNFNSVIIEDPKVSSNSIPIKNQICNSRSRVLQIPRIR